MTVKNAAAPAAEGKNTTAQKETTATPSTTKAVIVKQEPAEEPKTSPAPGTQSKPPIGQRLERFQLLEKYVTQLELVEESLEELQDFSPDPNGGDQIIIRRANGKSHSTNHPAAVEAMVSAAVAKLQSKKAELEDCIVL